MSAPALVHWMAIKKIMRYLSDTQKLEIMLSRVLNYSVYGFWYTDWGRHIGWEESNGHVDMLNSWFLKKQSIVALSSTKVEYKVIATTIEELKVVKALLTELGLVALPEISKSVVVYDSYEH